MTRRLVFLVPVVLAAALIVPAAYAKGAPTITFRHYTPLTVSGAGFAAKRTVRISVTWTGGKLEKRVRTDRKGAFRVSWATSVRPYLCKNLVAVVVNTTGRKLAFRVPVGLCGAMPVPTPPRD
jgi:hypothetical protein